MRRFAVRGIPPGGFDYFLISRKVLDIMVRMREKNTFIKVQVLWTGFEPKVIPYARRRRQVGRSRWTAGKKIKYFIDGFITYSYFPIRFISVTGIATALLGFLYAAAIFADKLLFNNPIKGWAPLMIVILVLSGLQMIMLGIIGEYLWRNYDEARRRPPFIIDRVISG
jgi:dolichol-phosphate mannosyltransferase